MLSAGPEQKKTRGGVRPGAAVLVVIATIIAAFPVRAQRGDDRYEFHIDEDALGPAMEEFQRVTGAQLLFSNDLAELEGVNALHGRHTIDEALAIMLRDTGLGSGLTESGMIVITRTNSREGEMASGKVKKSLLAGVAAFLFGAGAHAQDVGAIDDQDDSEQAEQEKDVIVVTGSRIKGVKDQFTPVIQVGREELDLSGYANVSDFFADLPQNFGGGTTIDTSGAGTSSGPGNASVNLRGLGNEATLILLNGRRMAGGGSSGAFVDISSIPLSAIDRVEVVTDGASAIYGSDAIAGVVNIILRDDFDGAETRLNGSLLTEGGGGRFSVGQTLGWSGDRAHVMATYEYTVEEELNANDRSFSENRPDPSELLPFSQKNSVFVSAGFSPTQRVKISADGYFNDRYSDQFSTNDAISLFQAYQKSSIQQYGGAVGVEAKVFGDWTVDATGSYAKNELYTDNVDLVNLGLGEIGTAETTVAGVEGVVGGSLFNITDEPVRAVLGVHYRNEEAVLETYFRPDVDTLVESTNNNRDIFAAFGELYAPLVSPGDGMPGVESFAVTLAGRFEEYSDVGSSVDPSFGVAWSPVSGLNLRGTFGTSFRAPRIDELQDRIGLALLGIYIDPEAPDGESVALNILGDSADLDPESSRTWTAGFDMNPPSLSALTIRATYFNTEFSGRVGAPDLGFDSIFRFINFTGIPDRTITVAEALDFCDRAPICANASDFSPEQGMFDFSDVEVLLDQRAQNLSVSKVSGIDFESAVALPLAHGEVNLSLAGTLLTTFKEQVAPNAPVNDLLNTYANPIDLKIRSGVTWRAAGVTTGIFVNHVGDYVDDEATGGDFRISPWTTVDAALRLDLGELTDVPLSEGAVFTLSVNNIFNEAPPRVGPAPLRDDRYDAANASPAGRKIGIQLTKRW